jgi:X-Pro dipeptidyl-peptidase (S15 family)
VPHLYEIDVRIPVRDGVLLAANVWRPVEGRAPTLLVRLPYSKDIEAPLGDYFPNIPTLLEAGYAVVMQDCRGTFRSEGEFVPHAADRTDGEDTIAWIAEQPWSDGTVGMYGPSYLGMVQWEAAVMKPPRIEGDRAVFYIPRQVRGALVLRRWRSLAERGDVVVRHDVHLRRDAIRGPRSRNGRSVTGTRSGHALPRASQRRTADRRGTRPCDVRQVVDRIHGPPGSR